MVLEDSFLLFINLFAGRYAFLDLFVVYFSLFAFLVIFLLIIGCQSLRVLVGCGLSLILALLLDLVINLVIFVSRPFTVQNLTLVSQHVANNSFPSTHTLLAFSLAIPLLFYSWKRGVFALILALGVGLSRLYLGFHWTQDLVGGILIAGITAMIASMSYDKLNKKYKIAEMMKIDKDKS